MTKRRRSQPSSAGDAAVGAAVVTAIAIVATFIYLGAGVNGRPSEFEWAMLGLFGFGIAATGFYAVTFLVILAVTSAARLGGPRKTDWDKDPWA